MPRETTQNVGPLCISSFITMEDVIAEADEKGLYCSNIEEELKAAGLYDPYLLELTDDTFVIAMTCRFFSDTMSFTARVPAARHGRTYAAGAPIPNGEIRRALKLGTNLTS